MYMGFESVSRLRYLSETRLMIQNVSQIVLNRIRVMQCYVLGALVIVVLFSRNSLQLELSRQYALLYSVVFAPLYRIALRLYV